MEDRGEDTRALFTSREKKCEGKESDRIHRKGGSSFHFLKHRSLEKQ